MPAIPARPSSVGLTHKQIKRGPLGGSVHKYHRAAYNPRPAPATELRNPTGSGLALMLSGMHLRGEPGLIPIDAGNRRRQP